MTDVVVGLYTLNSYVTQGSKMNITSNMTDTVDHGMSDASKGWEMTNHIRPKKRLGSGGSACNSKMYLS